MAWSCVFLGTNTRQKNGFDNLPENTAPFWNPARCQSGKASWWSPWCFLLRGFHKYWSGIRVHVGIHMWFFKVPTVDKCLFCYVCVWERKRKERVMPQKHRRVGLYVCVFAFLDRVKATCSPSLFIKGLGRLRLFLIISFLLISPLLPNTVFLTFLFFGS